MGVFSWIFGWNSDDYADDDDEDALTTWEWVWSFVSTSVLTRKRREQDQRDKELYDKLQAVIRAESNPIAIPEEVAAESNTGCVIRSGQVSVLRESSGCIDGNIHFDIRDAPQEIKVGDKVMYVAFRASPEEDWCVRKVTAILDERTVAWDADGETLKVEPEDKKPQEEVVVDTMYRSELHQVTARNGREVIVSNGFRFCLDKVTTLFTPMVGDFLFLDAVVEVDNAADNLSGDILAISRVRWVRHKVVTGQVTAVDAAKNGVVGKDLFFNAEALKPGYLPCRGDEVNAEAIESYQGVCSWRALLVTPVVTRRPVRTNTTADGAAVAEICKAKRGIALNGYEFDFGTVVKGENGKQVTVTLKNTGDKEHTLMFADFYLTRRGSQVHVTHGKTNAKTAVPPGESLDFTFSCRGKFIGISREVFVFTFRDFKVGCHFQVDVCDLESVRLISEDHTVARPPRCSTRLVSNSGFHVVYGVRSLAPPKFIANRLERFEVPRRYTNAVVDEEGKVRTTLEVEKLLRNIAPSLYADLTFRNYRERFHAMLYLEEIDSQLKIEQYSMETVHMTRVGSGGELLSLEVPGLAEKRPSVLVGDKVYASRPWEDSRLIFEGFVHELHGKNIYLKFNHEFHLSYNGNVVNVRFEFGRSTIRKQHAAIEIAMTNLGERILFPNRLELQPPQIELVENEDKVLDGTELGLRHETNRREIAWVNKLLNFHQKEAVRNVLRGEARPLPYMIFGPPGTGKTMTMVETILQIFFLLPDSRLLVATPSNSSANLIAERLLDAQMPGENRPLLKPGDLVRLVSHHVLDEGGLPDRLRPYSTTACIRETSGDEAKARPLQLYSEGANRTTLGRHRITVGTCIALGHLVIMGFPQGHFTHVLVDEAGQATEPEVMVPLGFLDGTGQAVLAGDPLQLGPVVGSRLCQDFGLGESYLDRLIHRFPYHRDLTGFPDTGGHDPRLVTQLVDNYRSLPEILALPNELFYDSLLVSKVSSTDGPEAKLLAVMGKHLPVRDPSFPGPPPIIFHGVVGTNLQDKDSPSWFNPQEALAVLDYLTISYDCGLTPDDVGIITPYRKQVLKMRWYYNRLGIELPKIGSVEEFQGQERQVIIMSAVRSNPKLIVDDVVHSLGFVASPKRLNVAITRARTLLVIIGNPHLLAADPCWRSVIRYCLDRQCYTGCEAPLSCVPQNAGGEAPLSCVPQDTGCEAPLICVPQNTGCEAPLICVPQNMGCEAPLSCVPQNTGCEAPLSYVPQDTC